MNTVAELEKLKKPKVFKGMSVAVKIERPPNDMSMSRYTINSEPVLLGPPAGKTGAGYRWTVREGWVVREDGKQIAAFITKQEAIIFRDRRSVYDDDAPDEGRLSRSGSSPLTESSST
ncbi:MAG: hypothetical protein JWO71_3404 [Candidatus Acidoferrum typicum]|nr:hypothetical protein [Candidatus Acidoferrum typicum]